MAKRKRVPPSMEREELHESAAALIRATPGARNLDDVQAITGRSAARLLAEVSGLSLETVRKHTGLTEGQDDGEAQSAHS